MRAFGGVIVAVSVCRLARVPLDADAVRRCLLPRKKVVRVEIIVSSVS